MRATWTSLPMSAVAVYFTLTLASNIFANDDRYAQPRGEDYYGVRYAVNNEPIPSEKILDDLGRFEIPSFINLTIEQDESECWVIDQVPAPGTIITGNGQTVVQLKYTCGQNDEYWARLPIDLVDVTPPEINVDITSNGTPHISFGGVLRFVAPSAVVPLITTWDACDQQHAKTFLLDGHPYTMGTPISTPGYHSLQITTEDESGNKRDWAGKFEIRPWTSYTAGVVLANFQCEFDQSGQTGIVRAEFLISSNEFDHRDIYLGSLGVMLRKPSGGYYNSEPIRISGGITPGCVRFQDQLAAAEIDECVIAVEIEAIFTPETPNECPTGFDIVGIGLINGDIGFEWGARTNNIVATDPRAAIQSLVPKPHPCGNPQPPPPPPPPPPCQPVETVIDSQNVCNDPWTPLVAPGCGGGDMSYLFAWSLVYGNSKSQVFAQQAAGGGGCTASSQCDASGFQIIIVQLPGCCNCSITFNASATISATASVTGSGWYSGKGIANGSITMTAPCGSGAAIASNMAQVTALISNGSPAPVTNSGSVNCTVNACTGVLSIQSSGHVETEAFAKSTQIPIGEGQSVWLPGKCTAEARLFSSINNISVTGNGTPCEPDPCEEP